MNLCQTLEGVSKMTDGTAAKVISINNGVCFTPVYAEVVEIPMSELLKQFHYHCRKCDELFACEVAHLVGEHGERGCEMNIHSER